MTLPSKIGTLWMALALSATFVAARAEDGPWPVEKAKAWQEKHVWLRGSNFITSTAINELEMWQAATFDEATIDRELGYAESLGFNSIRVFLHSMLWEQDSAGFLQRMDKFLSLTAKHHIGVMFVPFDSCWNGAPKLGTQPEPKPFTHNSGWVQSPGLEVLKDPSKYDSLKPYIVGVIGHFRDDPRINAWDLFNEPNNTNRNGFLSGGNEPANKGDLALQLLRKEFEWARSVNPIQPLTTAPWEGEFGDPEKLSPLQKFQFESSDVISFHNYGKLDSMKRTVENLRRYGRPILCSEYMARPQGSKFDPHFGYLAEQKVGAYNWGFVSGKSQTIFPWDSWDKHYTAEPPLWFHDIFRADGTPYLADEVAYIRKITGVAK